MRASETLAWALAIVLAILLWLSLTGRGTMFGGLQVAIGMAMLLLVLAAAAWSIGAFARREAEGPLERPGRR